MPLLAAVNVSYSIGTRVLLDRVNVTAEPGQRLGIVGRNGTGKTTLFRILAGRLKPDSGSVSWQRGVRVGYLTQDPELDASRTLREEAATAFVELGKLKEELDEVFHALERSPGTEETDRLLRRQSDLQHRLEAAGGYAVDHRVDAVLHGLGFTDEQFAVPVRGLSGGQKGRLALAKLLLEMPEVLLLDEPTNHLDLAGREWLEGFLAQEYRGAVIMVSHDRYLLDRVVQRIVEVEDGRLIDYPGNYSAFTELRRERRMTQLRAYEKQQTRFRSEEAYIRKYKAGQRAKQARGRETKLEREKEASSIERPMELDAFRFALPKPPRSGDIVVSMRGAGKWYRGVGEDGKMVEKRLFKDFGVTISRGERWGIIGPNGAGKTTLVRCMLGETALDAGTAAVGSNVVVGYFRQLAEEAGGELPVYQYLQGVIRKENPGQMMSEQQARDLAGAFLFGGSEQDKPMDQMSGGERSRARLAGLLASAKNLLVLDEPTNHLDIPSAERLEEALAVPGEDGEGGYEGTVLLISHDRALIDAVCDHLIVLDGEGGATVFHGNYAEWHLFCERRAREAAAGSATRGATRGAVEDRAVVSNGTGARTDRGTGPEGGADGKAAKKGGGGGKRPLSWMASDRLEKEIERLSGLVRAQDELMSREDVYRDAARCREVLAQRAKLAGELGKFEEEWLLRAEEG